MRKDFLYKSAFTMDPRSAAPCVIATAISCAGFACLTVHAQKSIEALPAYAPEATAIPATILPDAPPPSEVAEMLDDISPANIKRIVDTLASFGTRHTLSDTESDERGIGAARRWIKSEFDRYIDESGRAGGARDNDDEGDDDPAANPAAALPRAYFDTHTYGPDRRRIDREVEIVNVILEIPGTSPEARGRRYYIVGHYDSRASDAMDITSDAPGANDDASGVAAVMELARVMLNHEYAATLVFMATAGEEQGLLGARLHAERAAERNLDIRGVLSNDIVGDPSAPSGAVHDHLIRIFSEGTPRNAGAAELAQIRNLAAENDSPSRQLARYVAEIAAWSVRHDDTRASEPILPVQPLLIFRPDRFLRGGDHSAFNDSHYAAVRLTVVEENYNRQHQDVRIDEQSGVEYGDTPEYVDSDYLANVARLNAAALAHLACAPAPPENARIIIANLANDTTIRWGPSSASPDVAGYEIVWRDTTSPVWQFFVDVGAAGEATLPLSKDNFFFGVRAYDRDGYRSPVAWPSAARE